MNSSDPQMETEQQKAEQPQQQPEVFPFRQLYKALDENLEAVQKAWDAKDVAAVHQAHHKLIGILVDLSHGSFLLTANKIAADRKASEAGKSQMN